MIGAAFDKDMSAVETIPVADTLDLIFSYGDSEASVTGYRGKGGDVTVP